MAVAPQFVIDLMTTCKRTILAVECAVLKVTGTETIGREHFMEDESLLKISEMQANVHVDPISFEPGHPKRPRAGVK